jgi:hypothetical protein
MARRLLLLLLPPEEVTETVFFFVTRSLEEDPRDLIAQSAPPHFGY